MKYVVDSSVFIEGFLPPPDWEIIIPPSIQEEVRKKGLEFSIFQIISPRSDMVKKVLETAQKSGDLPVLSNADIEALAVALQENATLVTDDYAMQNVAEYLGIKWLSVHQRGIRERRRWKWRCTACGRYFTKYHEKCPVCGGELKRVKLR